MKYLKDWAKRNKVVTALAILLFTGGILYILFAHKILEAMYNGESIDFLNNLIKGQGKTPLKFYLKKADIFYFAINILFIFLALGSSFCLRLNRQKINLFYLVKQEKRNLKEYFLTNQKAIFQSLILFLIFYFLYIIIGILLIPNYNKFAFFNIDLGEYVGIYSFSFSIKGVDFVRWSKGSHPLFILFLFPFSILRAFSPPLSQEILAVILNSFFGASAIFLASLAFWNLTKRYFETLLLTILFGLSMSQLVFSSVPGVYSLASCSIITTYILFIACLQSRRVYLGYWIFAGIFSFGVTITNFAQTLICFTAVVLVLKQRKRVVTILEYVGAIVTFSFLLSILQKQIFPLTQYFFMPNMVTHELGFVKTSLLSHPLLVLKEIIKNFFLVNFVSSSPFTGEFVTRPWPILASPIIMNLQLLKFYLRPLDYSIIGLIGMIIWSFLLLTGIAKNIIDFWHQKNGAFILAVSCSVLFEMTLHSFHGAKYIFLFTCHFTFPVLLLAVNKSIMNKTYFKIALVSLIVLMGINNLMIMRQIISA